MVVRSLKEETPHFTHSSVSFDHPLALKPFPNRRIEPERAAQRYSKHRAAAL
jgi:hypothetical protein